MADEIQGLSRLIRRVGQMATDTRHVERPLKAAGVYMLGSIEKNFQQQGRPKRWTPLAQSTLAQRRKGRGRGGPRILIDQADLKNSISHRVLTHGVEIGSRGLPYARRQQLGYEGGSGPGHSKTPARPYLVVQEPEDVNAIGNIFRRHVARK